MTDIQRYSAADLPELMEKITRNSIGLDDYFQQFWDSSTNANYPPYNIVHVNNVESRLEIALAGFKKKEVKVYTEYGKIFVEGTKKDYKWKYAKLVDIPEEQRDIYEGHSKRLDVENANTYDKDNFLQACKDMGITERIS